MLTETAMLMEVEGPSAGKRYFIEQAEVIIGRDEACDLVVPDRQVSRHHARIRQEGGRLLLEDLGSKNGTFVNGQELEGPHPLQDGDEIQIALCCKLTFVGVDATAPVVLEEAFQGLRLNIESKRVWVAGRELAPPS